MSDVQTQTAPPDAPTVRRAKFIINPAAWQGSGGVTTDHCVELLARHGIHAEITPTTEDDHGSGLARRAQGEGYDLVIAGGGDGTIHDVATGLIGTGIPLGILPLGTMNNVAASLHIPTDLDAAAAVIAQGRRVKIDVGQCNGRPFLEAVSIGLEAPMFPLTESLRHSGLGGLVRALFAGVSLLVRSRMHPIVLELDGHRRHVRARQVTISNAPLYGMGFSAAPNASLTDGRLDVAVSRYARRRDVLVHYWSLVSGQRELRTDIKIIQAKRVRVGATEAMPVAVDGVEAGATPLRVHVMPGALTVLAPAASAMPAAPAAPVSAAARLLRAIAPHSEDDQNPNIFSPTDSLRRLKALTLAYWLALTVLGTGAGVARWRRWGPFAPSSLPPAQPDAPVAGGDRTWRLTLGVLVAGFARLRLPLSALAALGGEGSSLLAALVRRVVSPRVDLPPPNETAMRAVAGMGALSAGLWVSRRATWRRNVLLAGLAWLAGWFSFTSRPTDDSPARRRDSLALGLGLGAVWLGLMLATMSWAERFLFRLTHSSSDVAALDAPPPPPEANTKAPPPENPVFRQAIVPVAVKQPLERGDIILFGPNGTFGARMIDLLTVSYYHHIALYDGEGMVIEAMPGGVRRYLLGQRRVTGIRPNVAPDQRRAAADWARARIGTPYDTPGLALIAFDRLLPGLRFGTSNASRFSCAVFVADAYLHAGVDLLPGKRWQDLVPGDFVDLMDTPPQP